MSEPRDGALVRVLRREPFLIAGVILLAALLRLPDLFGWWLNPDEGIYYGVVTRDGLGAAWREAMVISHPPLYLVALRAVAWLSTDFVALRSVSFVSGLAAVYVFVLLGREAGRTSGGGDVTAGVTGLAAGLLLAVSPRAIALSQVMRQYALLLLVLAAALLFLLRYLREPSTKRLVAYGACTVVAALLHYSTIFALGVFGILTLVDGFRRGMGRPAWRRLVVAQAIPALTLIALYFLHLRRIQADLGGHALEGWLAGFMIGSPRDAWLAFVGFHSMIAGEMWAAPAAVLTLAAGVWAWKRERWSPVLIAAVAGLAIAFAGAAVQLYPFGPTRHAVWLLVFVVPLLARAIAALTTSGRATLVRAL
ncbi:MAG: glycosyltransferase family 39 protein, partial [Gemmatimonadota bacterium]